MKILNLYAGIGGNRKGWKLEPGDEVTAVEIDENIANIYIYNFPQDKMVIGDAHEYLLKNFKKFDFIWSSPPCPTHSRVRKSLAFKKKKDGTIFEQNKPCYPDMKLYQEIILLDNYFEGKYCIENVMGYYDPLIIPQILGRHYFWANFLIPNIKLESRGNFDESIKMAEKMGFDLSNFKKVNTMRVLRNCVEPEISEKIFEAMKNKNGSQLCIFDYDELKGSEKNER